MNNLVPVCRLQPLFYHKFHFFSPMVELVLTLKEKEFLVPVGGSDVPTHRDYWYHRFVSTS
jgi:hypothetical protein